MLHVLRNSMELIFKSKNCRKPLLDGIFFRCSLKCSSGINGGVEEYEKKFLLNLCLPHADFFF